MNKYFELLLKVISKGTVDTLEEFDLFWGVSCIDDDWTKLYIKLYNEDEEEEESYKLSMWSDSLIGEFCLNISEYYDDFETEGINKLKTEYENECGDEHYYEYELKKRFFSDVMEMDYITYI